MEKIKDIFTQWNGGESADSIKLIVAAGSNRQYYRIHSNQDSYIGVEGTSSEENEAFIYLAQHFEEKKLPMPRFVCCSEDKRCYIQEDLGDKTLYAALKNGREACGQYSEKDIQLLRRTIIQLPHIQIKGAEGLDWSLCYPSPSMDKTAILFDLNYFKYNFLKFTGIDYHELKLEVDLQHLATDLEHSEPKGFMYRDFQVRNVMLKDDQPYFIDFQGGRQGPVLYDVASFLWQSSAYYSTVLRQELFKVYLNELGKFVAFDEPKMYEQLNLFVLFRLLQVLGAYGFRGLFERKTYFINSIGPALKNLEELLNRCTFNYPYLMEVLRKLCQLDCVKLHDRKIRFHRNEMKPAVTPSPYDNKGALTVRVFSFSYKKGIPSDCSGNGGGYVFDCRSTHNPGRYDAYKVLTGLDKPVIDFLEEDGEILDFLNGIYPLAEHHVERYIQRGFTDLMFSFGCTGGRHRSVYCAQQLAEHIYNKYGVKVILDHREQGIKQILG